MCSYCKTRFGQRRCELFFTGKCSVADKDSVIGDCGRLQLLKFAVGVEHIGAEFVAGNLAGTDEYRSQWL